MTNSKMTVQGVHNVAFVYLDRWTDIAKHFVHLCKFDVLDL